MTELKNQTNQISTNQISTNQILSENNLKTAKLQCIAINNKLQHAMEYANKMAKHAEDSCKIKDSFLSKINEELRDPLHQVIITTHLLSDTQLDENQIRYVELLKSSFGLLSNKISRILDLKNLQTDIPNHSIFFDVRETIEYISETIYYKAQNKGLSLSCLIQNDVPYILKGNPKLLQTVISIFGNNAVKHTEKGEIIIHVSVEEQNESYLTLRIFINDTGNGIPKDKISSLSQFVVNFNVKETEKKSNFSDTACESGSDLGNVIRLLSKMGGTMGFESNYGKGSTFWFNAVFEKKQDAKYSNEYPNFNNKSILALVSNKNTQMILSHYLSAFKINTEIFSNVDEFIKEIQKPYDAIIVDFDDFDYDRLIGNIADFKEISIAVTSGKQKTITDNLIMQGFPFIYKPIGFQSIKTLMWHILNNSKRSNKNLSAATQETENQKSDLKELLSDEQGIPELSDVSCKCKESKAAFNIDDLKERMGGSSEAIEILETYVNDIPKRLEQIKEEFGKSNYSCINSVAHSIKGASAVIGVNTLKELASKIEQSSKKQESEQILSFIEQFSFEFEEFKKQIGEYINK